eukprot:945179-Pelagomonas_calceolata.AAC.1
MISIAGPTNTQKDGVEGHNFSTNEFAEVCMLPLCRLQCLPPPMPAAVPPAMRNVSRFRLRAQCLKVDSVNGWVVQKRKEKKRKRKTT